MIARLCQEKTVLFRFCRGLFTISCGAHLFFLLNMLYDKITETVLGFEKQIKFYTGKH